MKYLFSFFSLFFILNTIDSQSFEIVPIIDGLASAQGVRAADFDEDGEMEIVVAQFSQDRIALVSKENGAYVEEEIGSGDAPVRCEIGDINLDGRLDAVITLSNGSGIRIMRNNGDLEFSEQFIGTFDYEEGREFVMDDFDGDDDLDLVIGSVTNNDVVLFECTSPSFFSFNVETIDPSLTTVGEIGKGDFDGNGTLDVIANGRFADQVNIYFNDGDLGFTETTAVSDISDAFGNAVGDLNADEKLDFAVTRFSRDEVIVFTNNGIGQGFAQKIIDSDISGPAGIEAADINGDGQLDLVVAYSLGIIIYLSQDAAQLEYEKLTFETGRFASDFHVVDFDFDMDLDVVFTSATGGTVDLLRNNMFVSSVTDQRKELINVFPNPVSDILNIGDDSGQFYDVTISNGIGIVVLNWKNVNQINVSDLPAGVYSLDVTSLRSKTKYTQQVIIID